MMFFVFYLSITIYKRRKRKHSKNEKVFLENETVHQWTWHFYTINQYVGKKEMCPVAADLYLRYTTEFFFSLLAFDMFKALWKNGNEFCVR